MLNLRPLSLACGRMHCGLYLQIHLGRCVFRLDVISTPCRFCSSRFNSRSENSGLAACACHLLVLRLTKTTFIINYLPAYHLWLRMQVRDCWCVAFGNSFNDEERCVLAGYDNGDVKMFDLRANKLRWEGNVRNGVCGVQFDRRDINMNKFVVTCLESQFHVYDARTQHPHEGFASLTETTAKGASLWKPAHLPQNREVFMITAGDGTAHLYKYKYPDQRRVKDANGKAMGVIGSVELLAEQSLSSQPVTSFDWSADKEGLFCCGALDQTVRVGIATKLRTV